ncbi:protein FAM228A [Tachysurus ichikawai]
MPSKRRKEYSGVITLHRPVPPHLLYHTAPRSVGQKSSSAVEGPYVRSATRKSTRFITHPGSEADRAHTHSPCSLKHLMDHLVSEQQEVDSITQPLLDTENGFMKDLEHFLNHIDMLSVRRHKLLHKRWTECVWWPMKCSVEQRFKWRHCEGMKPTKMLHTGYDKYSAKSLPKGYSSFSSGCVDDCQWMASLKEQDRNKRDLHGSCRSRGPVYMATADGRCFRPGCWSANYRPHSYSVKS